MFVSNPCGSAADTLKAVSCCEGILYVPNSFTPNGDGLNDEFEFITQNIRSIHLTIYNRWGALIFQSHDLDKRWDGTFSGTSQAAGVYPWQIQYEDENGVNKHAQETIHW